MHPGDQRIRVLLVDDDVDFLDATAQALSARGFRVDTAEDGHRALRLLLRTVFDVMVVDVRMPGLDGIELFRAASARRPTVPVVILTGNGTFWQACATAREGLFEYLTKPCDIDALVEVLATAGELHRKGNFANKPTLQRPIRVLVVDEDTAILECIARTLTDEGLQVTCAAGASRAIAKIERLALDVALVNVNLPGLNGLDVMRHIKRHSPATEVILVAERETLSRAVEGCHDGAFDYVLKPIEMRGLADHIRKANVRRISRDSQARECWLRSLTDD